jgi:hypothetical protein
MGALGKNLRKISYKSPRHFSLNKRTFDSAIKINCLEESQEMENGIQDGWNKPDS